MDSYRMNELPETTTKYQTYTDNFEAWLLKTAAQRGLEVRAVDEAAAQKATKGKRKRQHKLPVRHLERLAQGIIESGAPLDDTSGLNDLGDAIRSRKEVTAYYRVKGSSDFTHPFFTSRLAGIRDMLWGFIGRSTHQEHEVEDERPRHILIQIVSDSDESEEEDEKTKLVLPSNLRAPESFRWSHKKAEKSQQTTHRSTNLTTWTKEEIQLEQDFEVLCFLYDLNQLRQFVRQVWRDYNDRNVNIVTAALLTDLALGVIKRNIDALIEDLQESGERSMVGIVKNIYGTSPTPAMADLLCISAIQGMEEYQRLKVVSSNEKTTLPDAAKFPFMKFLMFFDNIRDKSFVAPEMDNFTEAMFNTKTGSEPWLPFGLQIMIDIQPTSLEDTQDVDVWADITDESIMLSKMMKDHIQYEDDMWNIGVKPDYISQGDTKFSNVFLQPALDILEWSNQLVKDGDGGGSTKRRDRWYFLASNPVLGGLVLYRFRKNYQSVSIQKIQWFIICLSHIYNAAKQIGGLDIPWPDLDFIIEKHGANRIFVGAPPSDPSHFKEYLALAMCTSARQLAKDNRSHGKWLKVAKEMIAKRGLMPHFPLQEKIRDYFGPNKHDDRWIRLHNLFVYVSKDEDLDIDVEDNEARQALQNLEEVFVSIASPMDHQRFTKKNRDGCDKKPNVSAPDFSSRNSEHVRLLSKMKHRIRDNEQHFDFDYLSFYRRAFAFIIEIRGEVLFDSQKELRRLDSKEKEPDNFHLLVELFKDLKIKPKNKDVKAEHDAISTDVVATEQLCKIAKALATLIKEEGREELNKVEGRLRRWWDAFEVTNVVEPVPEFLAGPTDEPTEQRVVPSGRRHRVYKEQKGIHHRITFYPTLVRKRKAFIQYLYGHDHCIPVLNLWTVAKGAPHRLVGYRKHRISFKCFGCCSMAKACLGLPSKLSELRNNAETWDEMEETENVSDFDSEYDEDELERDVMVEF